MIKKRHINSTCISDICNCNKLPERNEIQTWNNTDSQGSNFEYLIEFFARQV